MNQEERLERSKRLIASMDAMTFQESADRFAPPVRGENAPTYNGLRPTEDGYLEVMCKAKGIKYTEQG
ncbi:Hypothetical protein PMT_2512 [Prochlorococcus marinus str. MIT 9313]|uniref:Uncharacterized protein n=1 Tax=Prochlorococcus marinus (strain MIT 9313) TaxID=74547 RepID=B9ERT0_PROMM|nr:hypothetical protein [Prochlorococcus marinus]CAX32031.1 Hypothetical protein PMT_2512 [Prochlorococcus marinus str. MIT 9313]